MFALYLYQIINGQLFSLLFYYIKFSLIKEIIDGWYASNIEGKTYESLLEDTIWCNDRSAVGIGNYETNNNFYFSTATRTIENTTATPTFTCPRKVDKFTVESTNGNGDLTYPIGMLTADEILMAGNTKYLNDSTVITTYLTIPTNQFWTLSPFHFSNSGAAVVRLRYGGLNYNRVDSTAHGVQPAISLGKNATVSGGNGSFSSPFMIN